MESSAVSRWMSFLKKFKKSQSVTGEKTKALANSSGISQPDLIAPTNPVANYYRQKVRANLDSFIQFALRSRSLLVRDIFALASSESNTGLADLLGVIEYFFQNPRSFDSFDFKIYYDHRILLSLADLLANTARNQLDTHAALLIYDFVFETNGSDVFEEKQKLQYVEALVEGRRSNDLDRLAETFGLDEVAPLQLELLQIQGVRQSSSEELWLRSINEFYTRLGMSNIRLVKDNGLPLLDRLESDTKVGLDGPKISVIMPTFSPGPGIWTAIRSLLQQTWKNLEIIIVDDASPAEYRELFFELEKAASNIHVLRQERNAGAYVARNRGLAYATGEFITVHDDDDWSHPDKLALQINALLNNENMVASSSAHVRATSQLEFRRVNTQPNFLQMNYSSLMFRRALTDELGVWDTVNRGADGEFLLRIITSYGSSNIAELSNMPLSFSRVWDGSLTSGEMSRGYFAPSRLLYRDAFRKWHRETKKARSKFFVDAGKRRQFPAPTTFKPGMRNADLGSFDVVFVTDYFRQAKYVDFVLAQLTALADAGLRVGFMQLPSPETINPAGFPSLLFELQSEGKLIQVAHNDVAHADLLVVYGSAMGMFLDETRSTVRSYRSILVHHELPDLSGSESRHPVLFSQSLKNLDACFDTHFELTGASVCDQEWLQKTSPRERMLSDDFIWYPIIAAKSCNVSTREGVPAVGFHSRGNVYRWPATKTEFVETFESPEFKTRLYGNIKPAVQKFGWEAFAHMEVLAPKDYNEEEFWDSIDFWIYYPHKRLSPQPWLPVLEAMQAGKVVILPERLKPTYGSAAVYAEPKEVSNTVKMLWNDTQAFRRQASVGQKFVAECFTEERLLERYRGLVRTEPEMEKQI